MFPCVALVLLHYVDVTSPGQVWHRDYAQALEQAEAAHKPLAVFIGSKKAGWHDIAQEGRLSPEVRRQLTEAYVCLYLDASQPADRQLADTFKAGSLPALVLSDHSRAYQAYVHAGALDNASLTAALQKYSRAEAFTPSAPALTAQEVEWRHDYAAARREAREKQRPIVATFGTLSCVWCKRLEALTFRDPGVIKQLNEQFIPLKIDAEREPELVQTLQIQKYPTLVLAAPDGTILESHEGFVEVAHFNQQLNRALKFSPVTNVQALSAAARTGGRSGPNP
jgi:thioredoxin-related protein